MDRRGTLPTTDSAYDGYSYTKKEAYRYDEAGNVIESMDYVDYVKTVYLYDSDSRPIQTVRYNAITGTVSAEFSESAIYNSVGLTSSISDSYLLNGSVYSNSYHYAYDEQQRLTAMHYDSTTSANRYTYAYDGLSRVTGKTLTYGGLSVSQTLGYLEGENSFDTENATGRVGSLTSKVGSTTTGYSYTYDDRGNITAIRVDGVLKYSYEYDNLNQLTRENNAVANKTYVYTYDDAGNILYKRTYAYTTGTLGTVQSTYSYTYGNSQWGDQLTAYRGTTITYDALGNPLSYYNGSSYTLSWTKGRWLTTMKKGSADTVSYQYNADGIRIGKVSSEKAVTYVLSGSQIIAEKNGSNIIRYLYDAQGFPVGMILNSTVYLYEKNLQGDVIAVYTTSGTKVASYTYDAWGKLVSSSYTDYTVFSLNPFRYRGYYYDTESGFYYLQSRYYDPTTGRFLNADGYVNANGDLQGFNMYAYCSNNPIMYSDPTGRSITLACIIIGAVIGAVAGGCTGAYISKKQTGKVNGWAVAVGAVGGGVIGGLIGWGVGAAITAFGATATGGSATAATPVVQQVTEKASTALQTYYPPNDGFSGAVQKITLEAGTLIQRTGDLVGRYIAPAGTPTQMLSLPYDKIGQPTTILQIQQSVEVLAGRVAPWFGQIGGGIQYQLGTPLDQLIIEGIIKIFGG